jgi:Zn-dependent M32 family carboxypeptidase
MPEKIVYKEEELEQMIQVLQNSASYLQEFQQRVQAIAQKLENGVLVGQGGEAFANGLNNQLSRALDALAEKLQEEAKFVQTELEQNRAARKFAQGRFN